MSAAPSLFDGIDLAPPPARYPAAPGYKRRDTARKAAERVAPRALTLRDQALVVLRGSRLGMTADEVAAALGKSILSIRPRISELVQQGKVVDSGDRRENASTHSAVVWRVA